MKRFLMIFLTLVTLNVTFAQNNEQDASNITEAERIIDKYGNQIVEGFNSVVETATPYAKEGFEMAVKLQIAKGIGEIIKASCALIFIFIILYLQRLSYNAAIKEYDDWETDSVITVFIIGGILQLSLLIYAIACLYDGILYLYAPEWWAIQDIFNLIK